MSPTVVFTEASDELRGKRAACVAGIIKQLCESEGEPIPWSELCDNVGMDHHGQLMPAMHALELCGVVDRFVYTEGAGTRGKPAFALAEGVTIVEPD